MQDLNLPPSDYKSDELPSYFILPFWIGNDEDRTRNLHYDIHIRV